MMARVFRAAIFVACLLSAGSAFAAGGSCGSIPVPSGVTSCFYISAAGADTNSGTSESSPWLHAPGMANCSNTCRSTTPAGGEGFIFRGGDTWHFGNNSASPYTGSTASCSANNGICNWVGSGSGSNGSPIYWGVDQTWDSSGSWTRPIINGDNPTSSSGVSSCAYDETKDTVMNFSSVSYNVIDNFEFTGLCWNGNEENANEFKCCTKLISYDASQGTASTHNTIENVYIHGWTHVNFSCSLSGGEPTGSCDGANMINGTSTSTAGAGDLISHVVIDGSDTDERSGSAMVYACYDVEYSVFRYETNIVCNNAHIWHDDLVEHVNQSGDGVSHGNGAEFNVEAPSNNAFYNLVFRHLWYTGANEVTWWETPNPGFTDYTFNFLIYDVCPASNTSGCGANGNFFDVTNGLGTSSAGTLNAFNMTWVPTFSNATGGPTSGTVNWINNLCIIPGGTSASSCYSGGAGTINYLTNKVQDTSAAAGQGYTSSEIYAYSPTAASNTTVGTGTNEEGLCSALLGSADPLLQAAGAACQSDTTYACNYSTSTHSVSCPARAAATRPASGDWDVGTYQLSGAPAQTGPQVQPPQAPTNLQATVH